MQLFLEMFDSHDLLLLEQMTLDKVLSRIGSKKFRRAWQHWEGSELDDKTLKAISDHLRRESEKLDVDPGKRILAAQWAISQFMKGKIDGEQLRTVSLHDVEKFFGYQKFAEPNDIMQIDFEQLPEIVNKASEAYQKHAKRKILAMEPNADLEIALSTSDWQVFIPHNKEAACVLGAGTKWCTAWTGKSNRFHEYHREDSPLFIFINKKTGEKFQMNFGENASAMDAEDKPISILLKLELTSILQPLRSRYPVIEQVERLDNGGYLKRTELSEIWFNSNGERHREDGPAQTEWHSNGQKLEEIWCLNGERHRENGPAWTSWHESGYKRFEIWCLNGEYHRQDGPAWTSWHSNGQKWTESWYLNGKSHREDGPAETFWYENGQVELERWFLNGTLYGSGPDMPSNFPTYEKYHGKNNESMLRQFIKNEIREMSLRHKRGLFKT